MIQDIGSHIYRNEYTPTPPKPDSYALSYEGDKALVKHVGEEIDFLRFRDLEWLGPQIYEEYTYLFSIDGTGYYLVEHLKPERFPGYAMEHKNIFRSVRPGYKAFAGITGHQLYGWYMCNRFCGRCGEKLVKDKKERMMFCETCHNMIYPKLSPAVIIAITDGDRLLLSKYADRLHTKKYALIAGFAEIGESLEDTVRREVMEEVGLRVKNIRYYKSQPWSFSDTLLSGFFCDLDGDDTITLDQEELALAEWFEREKIPEKTALESLTSTMMMDFKNGLV